MSATVTLPDPLPPLFYVNRSDRGRLQLTGRDRQSFLQGMVTNDVAGLTPGRGCYAFMLQATGQVLGDMSVLCSENSLLLDVEPGQAQFVAETLDKYLIMEKCRITDMSGDVGPFLIGGTDAPAFLARYLNLADTEQWAEYQNAMTKLTDVEAIVAKTHLIGSPAFDIYLNDNNSDYLLSILFEKEGAVELTPDDLEILRIQAGVPRFGVDIDSTVLAPETGQASRAISYRKGCYIGQEIVARIHARGHTNRAFVGFYLSGDVPLPAPGSPVSVESNANAGRITSVAPASGSLSLPVALGYIRHEFAAPGTMATIDGQTAQVAALPFVEAAAKP